MNCMHDIWYELYIVICIHNVYIVELYGVNKRYPPNYNSYHLRGDSIAEKENYFKNMLENYNIFFLKQVRTVANCIMYSSRFLDLCM